jgi:flagellar motor switch protein FliN
MSDELLSQAEIEALMNAAQNGDAEVTSASQPAAEGSSDQAAPPEAEEPQQFTPPQSEPTGGTTVRVQPDTVVRPVEFAPMSSQQGQTVRNGVELILDVQLHVAVELGHTSMKVKDVLGLGPGSVVELDKHAGEPVEVVVNNKTVARGEVVVIDENFGVRITEIVNRSERPSYAKAA